MFRMDIFLTLQNCYEIVIGSEQRPTSAGKEKKYWDKRDKQEGALIKLSLSDEILSEFCNERSGVKFWDILKNTYANLGDVWILTLTTKLYNMKLSNS